MLAVGRSNCLENGGESTFLTLGTVKQIKISHNLQYIYNFN